jgi:hypothetical protein
MLVCNLKSPYLNDHLFLTVLDVFCYYFIECASHAFNFSPSTPMNWFGLLMVSQESYMLSHSYFFVFLSLFLSHCFNISILSLCPDILYSIWSYLLERLPIEEYVSFFKIWLTELFILRIFQDFYNSTEFFFHTLYYLTFLHPCIY